MKHTGLLSILLLAVLVLAGPVLAQEEPETIVSGLNNPRLLSYGSDGTLYIAEAGTGGEAEITDPTGNPVRYGPTSRIMALSADAAEAEVLVENLPSLEAFNNFVGANAILAEEDGTFWVVIGGPADIEEMPTRGIQVLDESLAEQRFIDVGAVEDSTNPDNDDVAANPADVARSGDTYYVVDSSGNAMYTVTDDGEPELFHVWEDLPVPTSVAVGPDGDIYVSFLSSFPFDTGSARIERWSPEGELVETYGDLTGVTDVLVDEAGTIYAVEFASGFGDQGWLPDSGRIVTVSADGVTPVLEGLNFPYGLAQAPDGAMVVSINTSFVEPGTGAVIRMESEMLPATTPEASG